MDGYSLSHSSAIVLFQDSLDNFVDFRLLPSRNTVDHTYMLTHILIVQLFCIPVEVASLSGMNSIMELIIGEVSVIFA